MEKGRKEELKRSYAETRATAGVLCIRNRAGGKVYVEGSLDVRALGNRLKSELTFKGCRNPEFQADWSALGAESFEFEVLESFDPGPEDTPEDVRELVRGLEASWLEKLQPWGEKGYNRKTVER